MTMARRVVARYLEAAPLEEYYSMPSPGLRAPRIVGWGKEQDLKFLEAATSYFQTRKDSWAIIVQPPLVSFPEVQAYVDGNPKLKRSKIIVVTSESLGGDFSAPEWVVIHDIVGHSIQNLKKLKIPKWEAQALHKALPPKYQLSGDLDSNDFSPDIYAAIFFHEVNENFVGEAAKISTVELFGLDYPQVELARSNFRFRNLYRDLLEDVARWTSGFKPGVPRKVEQW